MDWVAVVLLVLLVLRVLLVLLVRKVLQAQVKVVARYTSRHQTLHH